jgi:RNA polymerase sigma factor for flagellar operon FliA
MSADAPEVLARFHEHLGLVGIIARKIGRTIQGHVTHEDLVSYGNEGLLDAARRYDPERGIPFRNYAHFRVRGAIIDGVRGASHLPRRVHQRLQGLGAADQFSEGAVEDLDSTRAGRATAAAAEQALNDHLAGMATAIALGLVSEGRGSDAATELLGGRPSPNPEDALAERQLVELTRQALQDLPEQEATLVRRHYFEGERFDHVAAELGLSKSWASRLHTRALTRLSKRLKSKVG